MLYALEIVYSFTGVCVCNLAQSRVSVMSNKLPPPPLQQYNDVTGCLFSYFRYIGTVFPILTEVFHILDFRH